MPPKRTNTGAGASQTPTPYGLALPGATGAWGASAIPIDPALQPNQQAAYANFYAQYHNYAAGYQQHYAAMQAQQQQQQQQQTASTSATTSRAHAQTSSGGGGGGGGDDFASLNDVLGTAGVDIRAEEEGLHRSHTTYRLPANGQFPDRARRPMQINPHIGTSLRTVARHHKVTNVPDESVHYLAFALQMRLTEIVQQSIDAAKHRLRTDVFDDPPLYEDGTPMWSKIVRRDVAKQLALIERVEREEEMKVRAKRKERQNAIDNAIAATNGVTGRAGGDDMDLDDDEAPKKKRKKEMGPGVTAKNMSAETAKKMSDAAASHAVGRSTSKYAWMHAGNIPATGPGAKSKAPAANAASNTNSSTSAKPAETTGTGKGWARGPFISTKEKEREKAEETAKDTRMEVILKDVMFVVDKERGHGGGRGSARGWT